MDLLKNLKETLYHYEYIQSKQLIPEIAKVMQPIIDKLKQEIMDAELEILNNM